MEHYAGIDVSLEQSSVCVVDGTGRIVREARVASEPEALVRFLGQLGLGGQAEALEPADLRELLRQRAEQAAERHASTAQAPLPATVSPAARHGERGVNGHAQRRSR